MTSERIIEKQEIRHEVEQMPSGRVLDKDIPLKFWAEALKSQLAEVRNFIEALEAAKNSDNFKKVLARHLKSHNLDEQDPMITEVIQSEKPTDTAGQVQNLLTILDQQLTEALGALETTQDQLQLDPQIGELVRDEAAKLFRTSIFKEIFSKAIESGATENSTAQFINGIIIEQERTREEDWQNKHEARRELFQEIKDSLNNRHHRQTIAKGLLQGVGTLSEEDIMIQRVIEKLRANPDILNSLDDYTKERLQDALKRILIIKPLQEDLRHVSEMAETDWAFLKGELVKGSISAIETVRRLLFPIDQLKTQDAHILVTRLVDSIFQPDEPAVNAFELVLGKIVDIHYLAQEIEDWKKAELGKLYQEEEPEKPRTEEDEVLRVSIDELSQSPLGSTREKYVAALEELRDRMSQLLKSSGAVNTESVENRVLSMARLYEQIELAIRTGRVLDVESKLQFLLKQQEDGQKHEKEPKSNKSAPKGKIEQDPKEKKYPPLGEAIRQRISAAEEHQATSLKPRNQGVTHRRKKIS